MQEQLSYKVDETKLTEDYNDFIGTYNGFFPEEFCQDAINLFNFSSPIVKTRNSLEVTDDFIFSSDFIDCPTPSTVSLNVKLRSYFNQISDFLIGKYIEKYNVLKALEGYRVYDLKMQKIKPKEGFHLWHYENILRRYSDRRLVLQLYLNDVRDGGETEFLYYSKRITPKQGQFLIYPATFTHSHRGNPPLSGNKYIITSWVEGVGKD